MAGADGADARRGWFAKGPMWRETPRKGAIRVMTWPVAGAATLELARQIAAKPAVPVIITKDHVNAISRSMTLASASYGEGDVLLGTLMDPP